MLLNAMLGVEEEYRGGARGMLAMPEVDCERARAAAAAAAPAAAGGGRQGGGKGAAAVPPIEQRKESEK